MDILVRGEFEQFKAAHFSRKAVDQVEVLDNLPAACGYILLRIFLFGNLLNDNLEDIVWMIRGKLQKVRIDLGIAIILSRLGNRGGISHGCHKQDQDEDHIDK